MSPKLLARKPSHFDTFPRDKQGFLFLKLRQEEFLIKHQIQLQSSRQIYALPF
jgi:hypothetical protein